MAFLALFSYRLPEKDALKRCAPSLVVDRKRGPERPRPTNKRGWGLQGSSPEATWTCKIQQNSLQKGSRYGISVSTPHGRYGHDCGRRSRDFYSLPLGHRCLPTTPSNPPQPRFSDYFSLEGYFYFWKSRFSYRYRPEGIFRFFFCLILAFPPSGTYASTAKRGKFIRTGHFSPLHGLFLKKGGGDWYCYTFFFSLYCKKGKGHQNRAPSLLEPRVFF